MTVNTCLKTHLGHKYQTSNEKKKRQSLNFLRCTNKFIVGQFVTTSNVQNRGTLILYIMMLLSSLLESKTLGTRALMKKLQPVTPYMDNEEI